MLILSINQGWDIRQVDFSNDFVQATFVEDFFLALPYYFESNTGEYRSNMVMKINKNLYGLVQSPLFWSSNTKGDIEAICFKPSNMDICMFYIRVKISIIYVDDVLLFGPDQDNIDNVIKELEVSGVS